jgi:hypothetical protein
VTEQQPSEVVTTFGSLENHINQFCAYEQSGTPTTMPRRPEKQPSKQCNYGQYHGARLTSAVLTGPITCMRSFLKVLWVYLERVDPRMLRAGCETNHQCLLHSEAAQSSPLSLSCRSTGARFETHCVGERNWKRIQMYHREICKNLQKRRVRVVH